MLKGDGGKDSAGVWFTAIGGVVLLLLLTGAYGLAVVVLIAAPVGYLALVGQGVLKSDFVESFVGTSYGRRRQRDLMHEQKARDRVNTDFKKQTELVRRNGGIPNALKYDLLKEHLKIGALRREYVPPQGLNDLERQEHKQRLWAKLLRDKNVPDGPYSRDEEIRYWAYYGERQKDDGSRDYRLNKGKTLLWKLRSSGNHPSKDIRFLEDELEKIYLRRAYDDPGADIEEWKRNRERVWQQRLREKGIGQDGEGT